MIEWLESIDRQIVLTINGWNSPFLDELMWIISGRLTWIPLYLFLIFLGFRKLGWKTALVYVACVVLAIGCTDFICSSIIKESIQRYRPSHNLLLTDHLHFYADGSGYVYKGGMYGFVSSHAGNFFALAWMVGWILKPHFKWLLPALLSLAVIISYSRIYLGVHYLSDILGGFIIGTIVSLIVYRLVYLKAESKIS
jgi:undecaprenyl-diphosphatase